MKERLKSPIVWLSILAQLLVILGLYMPEITEPVKITSTAIIEIATIVGILNNPTDKENF